MKFLLEELRVNLENVYDPAHENLGTSAVKQKNLYDLGAIDEPYSKGDLVWPVNKSKCKEKFPNYSQNGQDGKVVPYFQLRYRDGNIPQWITPIRKKLLKPHWN